MATTRGGPVGTPQRNPALARPAPLLLVVEVAIFRNETRRFALQMCDQRRAVRRQIVTVDAAGRLIGREELAVGHAEARAQRRRVVDGVVEDFPVVETVIDRLEREPVALFVDRQRAHGLLGTATIAAASVSRTHCPLCPFRTGFLRRSHTHDA